MITKCRGIKVGLSTWYRKDEFPDLCNEWPGEDWATFMKPLTYGQWTIAYRSDCMQKAIALVRAKYPDMPLLFSVATGSMQSVLDHDLGDFDLLDPHIWMVQQYGGEF